MKISAITIENFKSISAPIRIELKPITLLFGPNSVGKSSVIQALHYAREILCNKKSPDIDTVEYGGDFVRLGGFKNIVHGHDLNRAIRLRFELGLQYGTIGVDDSLTNDFVDYVNYWVRDLPNDATKVEDFFLNQVAQGFLPWLEIIIKDFSVSSTSIGFGETTFLTFEGQTFDISKQYTVDTSSKLFPLDGNDSISSLRLEAISALEPFSDQNIKEEIDRRFNGRLFDARESLAKSRSDKRLPLPALEAVPDRLLQIYILMGMCSRVSATAFKEEYITYRKELVAIDKGLIATCQRFQDINNAVYSVISNYVQNDLNTFRYIGPLREVPQLSSAPPEGVEPARWANGLAAWDAMKLPQDTVNIVNKWLDSERFNTGYSIGVKHFKTMTIEVGQENEDAEAFLAMYKEQPISRVDLCLFDKAHGVKLQPSDIGIGISQLLPIITLVTGRYIEGITAIEQPELHIHPAMQLILGDLFIEGLNRFGGKNYEFKNRFIIETHSEHLLLRLLRRIRELACIDYDKLLYNEKEKLAYSNYDASSLAIHVLEPSKNGVKVTHIRVDEEGEY
jgi:hypothetical protein